MKQKMIVTHERTIVEDIPVGERYTCDYCNKVIVDTTKIEDEHINFDKGNIPYYSIYYKVPAGNQLPEIEERLDVCSSSCVASVCNTWNADHFKRNSPFGGLLKVNTSHVRISHVLDSYRDRHDNISLEKWNELKKNSRPEEDKKDE